MIKRKYTRGEKLEKDELLLKTRKYSEESTPTGFLTQLTQKGEVPKTFEDWGYSRLEGDPEIFVFEETYRSGWKLFGYRIGMSQSWIVLEHPEGFTLEVRLSDFISILNTSSVDKGELIGEYKWHDKRLLKKEEK